jgi:NADPH:quinone reductase-like Zn-dependent oxidoreductase
MTTTDMDLAEGNRVTTMAGSHKSNHSKGLPIRQLQLVAHGEPSDVIKLNAVSEPALGQEDVLISMEAAPINPSDFLFVRGLYGVRPAFPSSVGAEGVGRVAKIGSKVDVALQGRRVLIIPTYEQGTWADQVAAPVRNIVPMSDEADPLQLSMIGINPVTAYLLLNRYVSLMPGDWIGQTAANSAMGQYTIAFAKLAGVKTLNVVRREEAAEQVRRWGGDRVVLQGDNLRKDIEDALDGKKLSLVLDTAEPPWESWPSRSRLAARSSSTPCKVGSSQPSRPKTSSTVVLASTDSGSSTGYATRPEQRSRRFTRS